MSLAVLAAPPAALAPAAALIERLDACFLAGFGRLGPEHHDSLKSFAQALGGSPLGPPVAEAVAAVGRNEFVERHFAALAVGRAAIQGAQYDALRAQAAAALGRPAPEATDPLPTVPISAAGPLTVWQESARTWLMEIALAGFSRLDDQTLAPFMATLEQLQDEPRATRLAALLTGFLNELLEAIPTGEHPDLPLFRWVDLWTRAMVAALRGPQELVAEKVSGTFAPLGVDLRHHGFFVNAVVYGILETDGKSSLARTNLSSYKVDVVVGREMWKCFGKAAESLLSALGQQGTVTIKDTTRLPTGDLLWDGTAVLAKGGGLLGKAAVLAPGAAAPVLPAVAGVDRHPLQIAEPVYLDDFKMHNGFQLKVADGAELPLALNRLSGAAELKTDHVQASSALFGLLRFDGGRWEIQPLALGTKGKPTAAFFTGSGAAKAATEKSDTLDQLQERASRLLRKKS